MKKWRTIKSNNLDPKTTFLIWATLQRNYKMLIQLKKWYLSSQKKNEIKNKWNKSNLWYPKKKKIINKWKKSNLWNPKKKKIKNKWNKSNLWFKMKLTKKFPLLLNKLKINSKVKIHKKKKNYQRKIWIKKIPHYTGELYVMVVILAPFLVLDINVRCVPTLISALHVNPLKNTLIFFWKSILPNAIDKNSDNCLKEKLAQSQNKFLLKNCKNKLIKVKTLWLSKNSQKSHVLRFLETKNNLLSEWRSKTVKTLRPKVKIFQLRVLANIWRLNKSRFLILRPVKNLSAKYKLKTVALLENKILN